MFRPRVLLLSRRAVKLAESGATRSRAGDGAFNRGAPLAETASCHQRQTGGVQHDAETPPIGRLDQEPGRRSPTPRGDHWRRQEPPRPPGCFRRRCGIHAMMFESPKTAQTTPIRSAANQLQRVDHQDASQASVENEVCVPGRNSAPNSNKRGRPNSAAPHQSRPQRMLVTVDQNVQSPTRPSVALTTMNAAAAGPRIPSGLTTATTRMEPAIGNVRVHPGPTTKDSTGSRRARRRGRKKRRSGAERRRRAWARPARRNAP